MPFKIDTGADVSVMPENCCKQNFSHQLGKTQKRLYAAGMAIPVLGNFQATLEANGKVSHDKIYVVKNLHVSLLSAKASEELGFIQRLLHVNSNPLMDSLKDYPELFSGLGKLNKPYKIELNDQAQPYAIHTPRRIPFPLMNKTKQRLKEMEQQGALSSFPTLAMYNPSYKTFIRADASSFGLGAYLSQINGKNQRQIIAYASRSLSETELKYAQIEKEALALTWAMDKFKNYIIVL
ncbi:hypothetical protein LAZ67_2003021 [Cordylochernes scorpioides]|uniref:Reverse transcriptase/retrotransposon-derived protein RNase H-like domain-containing protein n=1 Tax=Cordylochernes scorpioides TaxID=51811 RepID=A0ABY6K739_9ARAC|nr:hypothetical protein LAZ67_2003021 [Cordylochernes scorpioides]